MGGVFRPSSQFNYFVIDSRATKITEQLRRKRKEMVLSYLCSRKQLEDLLSKRLRSLETVQSTLLKVESAAGDIEVHHGLLIS